MEVLMHVPAGLIDNGVAAGLSVLGYAVWGLVAGHEG
jgi:hypothetical protein